MFSNDFILRASQHAAIVTGSTELVKRTFKIKDRAVILVSFLVSFSVCLPELILGLVNYISCSIASALLANGFWKVLQGKKTP